MKIRGANNLTIAAVGMTSARSHAAMTGEPCSRFINQFKASPDGEDMSGRETAAF